MSKKLDRYKKHLKNKKACIMSGKCKTDKKNIQKCKRNRACAIALKGSRSLKDKTVDNLVDNSSFLKSLTE